MCRFLLLNNFVSSRAKAHGQCFLSLFLCRGLIKGFCSLVLRSVRDSGIRAVRAASEMEDTMEIDTKVASDFCSVCDTPEFPTTPSREVDVTVCTGPRFASGAVHLLLRPSCMMTTSILLKPDSRPGVWPVIGSEESPMSTTFLPRYLIHKLACMFRRREIMDNMVCMGTELPEAA